MIAPTKVALSDLARYDQDGNEESTVVFPFKVTLVPTGEVKFKEGKASLTEFSKQWAEISDKAAIYKFLAHSNPDDDAGTELGKIILDGRCTTSAFGDEHLFIRHQRIEDDIALKPKWKNAYLTGC